MISPLEGLSVDPSLACEFFARFARFEYALKATRRFCRRGYGGKAEPDWRSFKKEIGADLTNCDDEEIVTAITYLVNCPPKVQKCKSHNAVFESECLRGDNIGEKAIEAAKRVRNNLFHGGKHTPHSPPGRDERLICCSLVVLEACLQLRRYVYDEFYFYE
jgi:hypothetical protein